MFRLIHVICIGVFFMASVGVVEDLFAVDVDLSLAPLTQVVSNGDNVDIQLVAASQGVSQQVVTIDAILNWDPAVLSLQQIVPGGGQSWFVSDFLTDPGNINADLTDGDALYTALTAPGSPVVVPPGAGLVVATFRFVALQDSPGTQVTLVPSLGAFALTRVLFLFAEDITGDTTGEATVVVGSPDPDFSRGDANNDGQLNIADPVWILSFLFQSGLAPPCLDAGDANDDGGVDVSDPVYVISYLFTRGPPPPEPWVSCGSDPTADTIGCLVYDHCP